MNKYSAFEVEFLTRHIGDILVSSDASKLGSGVPLTKEECGIISRSLGMYEKSMLRAANAPDQLPGAADAYRKSVSVISALRSRFVGLI